MWQPGQTLDDIERITIESALKFYHGNKTQTANSLGITIRTLYNKLERYGVEDGQTNGVQTEERVRVEPDVKVSEEQSMSMRQRQEVQELPSKSDAADSTNKRSAFNRKNNKKRRSEDRWR